MNEEYSYEREMEELYFSGLADEFEDEKERINQEKCRCNEGINNGKEFDCACPIHKGDE